MDSRNKVKELPSKAAVEKVRQIGLDPKMGFNPNFPTSYLRYDISSVQYMFFNKSGRGKLVTAEPGEMPTFEPLTVEGAQKLIWKLAAKRGTFGSS